MEPQPPSVAGESSRAWIPLAVLLVALLIALIASIYVLHSTELEARLKWQKAVQTSIREVQADIASRINGYVTLLRGEGGFLSAEGIVSRNRFHTYAERLELERNYPGLGGLGFIQRVAAQDLRRTEAAIQQQGMSDFHIWPAGDRPVEFPIVYVERPGSTPGRNFGFDMFSDPARRAAIEAACDQGRLAATGKLTLLPTPQKASEGGFLMFLPVYSGGGVPDTVEQRRATTVGCVFAGFRCSELLGGVSGAFPDAAVDFAVYDGNAVSSQDLMYASAPAAAQAQPTAADATIVSLEVANRPWTLVFVPRETGVRPEGWWRALFVMASGAAAGVALYLLTRAQVRARDAAELARIVAERYAAERRRSEAALRDSLAERKRAERERANLLASEQSARADAEAANRSKDEFLATLSHELRTPLNAILGWAQLLRMGGLDVDETERGLETIERNAKLQAQLVEDLLDVSRIISGKVRLDLRPAELPAIVEAALDSVRPGAVAKRIRIVPVFDAHVGPVLGDPERLQQVAWNLLSNAIKFTPPGGRVELLLQRVDQQAEIQVTDNGQGIAPEFLPYVFDRLRQADASSTRRHGGLGLGLAIVRHLVELHGGTVRARSPGVGKGATFVVSLPIAAERKPPDAGANVEPSANESQPESAAAADGAEASESTAPDAADLPGKLDGLRVLVVDDEADARDVLARVLQMAGARVVSATSAFEAMEQFAQFAPQLLISDISMPGEDGYSLLRRIRALESGGNIPAVALSAFARDEDKDKARSAGFNAHVAKPFDPSELIAALSRLRTSPAPVAADAAPAAK
jgi:signal transduction histidine kinase/ActR/RegA family two-component response regulator